jgi:hypothetical protein
MKKIAIIIATVAILANLYYIADPPSETNDDDPFDNGDPNGNGDVLPPSEITSLSVPEVMIGDQARYDYELFAQMFWENTTSGEWGRYTFTGEGELLHYVDDIQEVESGFHTTHDALEVSFETRASFVVKIEGSDVDTAEIPGNLDLQRSKYNNVFDNHDLKAINTGELRIENLGSVFGSSAAQIPLTYAADLKTYPDPREDPVISIDDAIYGMGQVLTLNSRGSIEEEGIWGLESQIYNWSVEGAYELLGHDTFKINVSSNMWQFLFFNREFYVTDDYPFPIKGFSRTNSSYYGEEESFYIILETKQQIKDLEGSLKRGDKEIPWGDPSNNMEYPDQHQAGEFERWNYAPDDGTEVDRSSFSTFTLNEAVDHAIDNSPDLQEFLADRESEGMVLIEDSVWNKSTEDNLGRNTTYWWNLTFCYVYEMEEMIDYYEENEDWPSWRYRILVARSVEEDRFGEPTTSTFIAGDEETSEEREPHGYQRVWWGDGINQDNLALENEILTVTHAEKIMRIDNTVKDTVFEGNKLTEGIDFYYGVVGVNEQNNQGMLLLQQLTGVQTPTADNAFGLQSGQVWTGGSTFSTAVDANTGQMLYVTSIEGSELASIFGN